MPGRCSRSCSCLSCIILEQASQSELSCLNIDKDSYVSLEKCKEPPVRYRYFFDSTPLPQESPILQPEMVSRSCRSETLKGTRRLPNHRSQNEDKNCAESGRSRLSDLFKSYRSRSSSLFITPSSWLIKSGFRTSFKDIMSAVL